MKVVLLFLFLGICANFSFAKDSSLRKFEIFGGYNLNIHFANFNKLPGIPNCCPEFKTGKGFGVNLGLGYEHRIISNLWLLGKVGIMELNGTLLKDENTTIITPSGPTIGTFEHRMSGKFVNLGIEPSFGYNLFAGLIFNFGFRLGVNLIQKYEQVETIKEPVGFGTFIDSLGNDTGLRTRNQFSGDIPNGNKFQSFLVSSILYELPLNRSNSFRLTPELQVFYPLSEFVPNTDWKSLSLRFGLALKYVPPKKPLKERIYEKRYRIDTLKVETDVIAQTYKIGKESRRQEKIEDDTKIVEFEIVSRTDTIFVQKFYKLTGEIVILGKERSGRVIETPIFKIEEFVSNRMVPLLNYVFFEENSYEIPIRYKQLSKEQTKSFFEVNLFRDSTLDIYYHILNIIGKRLKENPKSKIILIGCNSDIGFEKGNTNLSYQRANQIKKYLVETWEIPESQIEVQARNLPAKPSTPTDEPDKIAENRRVEILSNDEKILAPIFIEKVDRIADPPIATFRLKAYSEAGLKEWKLMAYQTSDSLNKFVYSKEGEIIDEIDWELSQYQKITPKFPEPIIGELFLKDVKGNVETIKSSSKPIKVVSIRDTVKRILGNFEIEKFSLILFDFDKATIEGVNEKIIDFISKRIKLGSQIEIIGYTDRTGNPEYNKKLSEQRAYSAKIALKRQDAKAYGVGQEILLFNNDLPEGRFYCRTVDIIIKTKFDK